MLGAVPIEVDTFVGVNWLDALVQELSTPAFVAQAASSLVTTLVAILVAVVVMRKQLSHDQDLAAQQLAEARNLASQQLAEARELASEQVAEAKRLASQQATDARRLSAEELAAATADRVAARRSATAFTLGRALHDGLQIFEIPKQAQVGRWLTEHSRSPGQERMEKALEEARSVLGPLPELRSSLVDRDRAWYWTSNLASGVVADLPDQVAATALYYGASNALLRYENQIEAIAAELLEWDGTGELRLPDVADTRGDAWNLVEEALRRGRERAEQAFEQVKRPGPPPDRPGPPPGRPGPPPGRPGPPPGRPGGVTPQR